MEGNIRSSSHFDGNNASKLETEGIRFRHTYANLITSYYETVEEVGQGNNTMQVAEDALICNHLVEICVREDGELRLDGLENINSPLQPCICTVCQLFLVTDGAIRPTSLGLDVKSSAVMPSV